MIIAAQVVMFVTLLIVVGLCFWAMVAEMDEWK
jgi:hypothetical protein